MERRRVVDGLHFIGIADAVLLFMILVFTLFANIASGSLLRASGDDRTSSEETYWAEELGRGAFTKATRSTGRSSVGSHNAADCRWGNVTSPTWTQDFLADKRVDGHEAHGSMMPSPPAQSVPIRMQATSSAYSEMSQYTSTRARYKLLLAPPITQDQVPDESKQAVMPPSSGILNTGSTVNALGDNGSQLAASTTRTRSAMSGASAATDASATSARTRYQLRPSPHPFMDADREQGKDDADASDGASKRHAHQDGGSRSRRIHTRAVRTVRRGRFQQLACRGY